MFGLFKRTENRSGRVDIGELYSAFFGFGGSNYSFQISPAILAASISTPGGIDTLVTESRRLVRVSPLLTAYVRCMKRGIICTEPEAPMFADVVPERTAATAAAMWMRHHDIDVERDRLHRVITDGEFLLIGDDPGDLDVIPADGFTPVEAGPDWRKEITGYRVGKGGTVRRESDTLVYVGDRVRGEARALPWVGEALPYAAAVASTRIAAAHGIAAMAKITAIIENTSPDRIAAAPAGRSGVVATRGTGTADAEQPITSVGVGSVPHLRMHEKIGRIAAGPDAQAMAYEGELERDVAAALNIPLVELRGDFSSAGSFSNLRMAWTDAQAEYADRRAWWFRNYRIPVWRRLLDAAWMAGDLPRMSRDVLAALRMPTWAGPTPRTPAPEKDALTAKLLVESGIITAEQAEQLARLT